MIMRGSVMKSRYNTRVGRNSNPIVRTLYEGVGIALSPHLVGMHFHRWPEGSPLSPAPTYGFGTVRSHDYGGLGNPGMSWNDIHTAAGTYNWTTMDTWINTHVGRKTIYTLYGTPAWLRTSDTLDAYGSIGGASAPSDSATGFPALQAFITAMVNRYNDGTVEGRNLHVIEAWNEPKFDGLATGFWYGTAAQMADIARAVQLGINASVDPGVKVWSPGFHGGQFRAGSYMDTFLAAQSVVQAGTYGRDWIDEIAVHYYNHGFDGNWPARMEDRIAEINATIARYPSIASMPWNVSEQGPPGVGSNYPWFNMPPYEQARWVGRAVVFQGLMGAKSVCLYTHDSDNWYNFTDPDFAAPLNRVHAEVAGKTITQAHIRRDGAFDLVADGQLVRI